MAQWVVISIAELNLKAELNDSPTALAIREALPLKVSMSRWGEEYYGNCGLSLAAEPGARELMEVGELAYWPPGNALCVFFGPTPASSGDEPRAASAVNPIGRLLDSPEPLKELGASIAVEIKPA